MIGIVNRPAQGRNIVHHARTGIDLHGEHGFDGAIALAGMGLLIAASLAWLLAGVVTRLMDRVGTAAQKLMEGDLGARVVQTGHEPKGLVSLGLYFNRMADQLETDREVMAAALNEARAGRPRQERIPGQCQPRTVHAAERDRRIL